MQAHLLEWTPQRFAAIALFAPIFWLVIFLFASTRRLKKSKAKKK
jgi:succinate dehydrogenase hydrophobic anchor subunit